MIVRPHLGEPAPFSALAYAGDPCRAAAPGTAVACCLAVDHPEPFHIAWEVSAGQLRVAGVWDRPIYVQIPEPLATPPNPAGKCGQLQLGASCMLKAGHPATAWHVGVDPLGFKRTWHDAKADQ